MGDKTIVISFTEEQIKKYNGQNSKLCFSAGVGDEDNSAYNVIARSDNISDTVTIQWKDSFKIAATKSSFSKGVKFRNDTALQKIEFDERYTLPSDWTNGSISSDKLPGKSFKMVNDTEGLASAVIYKVIDGVDKPFYISASPIDPQGNEVMTPKASVALWFQKDAETGTMVSVNVSDVSEFKFSNRDSIRLYWDGKHFVEKDD